MMSLLNGKNTNPWSKQFPRKFAINTFLQRRVQPPECCKPGLAFPFHERRKLGHAAFMLSLELKACNSIE